MTSHRVDNITGTPPVGALRPVDRGELLRASATWQEEEAKNTKIPSERSFSKPLLTIDVYLRPLERKREKEGGGGGGGDGLACTYV